MQRQSQPVSQIDLIVIGGGVLLLSLLAFPFLTAKSMWVDEIISHYMSGDWNQFWQRAQAGRFHMWAYYRLLNGWRFLTGDSVVALRGFSTIFALATVPPYYLLGKTLFSRRVGALMVVLLGMNAFFLSFATEARAYSMFIFLAVLQTALFASGILRPAWWKWVAYSVVATLIVYVHPFGALLVPAHWASLAVYPLKKLPFPHLGFNALFMAVAAVVTLRVLPVAGSEQRFTWIYPFEPVDVFRMLRSFSGGLPPLFWLSVVVIAVLVYRVVKERPDRERLWRYALVVMWLVLPIAAVIVLSVLYRPAFIFRYMSHSAPAFMMLVALGVNAIPYRTVASGLLALFGAVSMVGAVTWYTNNPSFYPYYFLRYTDHPCTDWRDNFELYLQLREPGDIVTIQPASASSVFEYYADQYGVDIDVITYPRVRDLRALGDGHLWLIMAGCDDHSPLIDRFENTTGRYMQLDWQTWIQDNRILVYSLRDDEPE